MGPLPACLTQTNSLQFPGRASAARSSVCTRAIPMSKYCSAFLRFALRGPMQIFPSKFDYLSFILYQENPKYLSNKISSLCVCRRAVLMISFWFSFPSPLLKLLLQAQSRAYILSFTFGVSSLWIFDRTVNSVGRKEVIWARPRGVHITSHSWKSPWSTSSVKSYESYRLYKLSPLRWFDSWTCK